MSYFGKLPEDWTRAQIAESLMMRSARLRRLVELNAPSIAIEGELLLCEQAVRSFPSNPADRDVLRQEDEEPHRG